MGLSPEAKGSVLIEERIDAPSETVAAFIGDFRNAREWMVGVEEVEQLGEDDYRLSLQTPIGMLSPEVRVIEHGSGTIRWVYTSTVNGGGRVDVLPGANGGCTVAYLGNFHLKRGLLDRAVRAFGAEGFARRNGERSMARLKHLMEARRPL